MSGMESFEKRLRRFTFGMSAEIPLTMLNSYSNILVPQLRKASESGLIDLFVLGSHAIMQTSGQYIFAHHGEDATRFFLQAFVDGDTEERKFSWIAPEIHEMRNASAHRWSSRRVHETVIDDRIDGGWKEDSGKVVLNFRIYSKDFLGAFGPGGRIWNWEQYVSEEDLVLRKYGYILDWLGLEKSHPVATAIRELRGFAGNPNAIKGKESEIQRLITSHFGVQPF
ncbi:MAG: hypothetical protein ABIJ00_02535 [Candidatus Eisenbacteria bacterium]